MRNIRGHLQMTSQLARRGILPIDGHDIADETDVAILECEALDHRLLDRLV